MACSVSVLIKLNATSVSSLTSAELARNMSQSTSSRATYSIASEWEDQRVTSLSTGGSWTIRCLYSGGRKMAAWSDFPKDGSEWALYAFLNWVWQWSSVFGPLVGQDTCCWKFGMTCLRLALLKSPAMMEAASGCLLMYPLSTSWSLDKAKLVSACGGM